jgi:DNA-binding NtrC family response regulator
LADGDAFDVLAALQGCTPAPLVVAISGAATPAQTFRLAELGVRGFVAKPFGLGELREAIRRAGAEPPDLTAAIRAQVGHRAIGEVSSEVRQTMLDEALARTGGSRRHAAALLKISRQLLQYLLRRR